MVVDKRVVDRLPGIDRVLEAGGQVRMGESVAAMALGEQRSGVTGVGGLEWAYLNTWHAASMRNQADLCHGFEPMRRRLRVTDKFII
jgi:hypothetical protein